MLVIAHRGASGDAPENTLAAFRKAQDDGVKAIELDVHLTRDDELVVCHDAKIDRTSNGKGFIREYSLKEIRQYDFGSWFGPDFAGEHIPTLEEVLQLFQGTDTMLNIEIKNGPVFYEGIETKLLQMLQEYHFLEQAIVASFDHTCLKKIKSMEDRVKTSFVLPLNMVHPFDYFERNDLRPYSIQPKYYFLPDELIHGARERQIKVFPYTINDVELGEEIRAHGVDGLITDFPKQFLDTHRQG